MAETAQTDSLTQSLIAWVKAVNQGALSPAAIYSRLDEMRLEHLVLRLLEIDPEEAVQIDALSNSIFPFERSPERFHEALQQTIRQLKLFKLFTKTCDGEYHRSVCPSAYNACTGENYPEEMARWRAYFRAMSPEQQMVVSTIVWMYRSGPDSIWLRRVPCTWTASEALHYMHDAGCLSLWLQLIGRYPGW
ncbi:hypothetical protein ACIPIX_12975 [Pseudomonas protegens]|uniref:hypothetical protein n=1 Tax=Pseudomonas protegens TaxID=380021 RepID=UPI00381DB2EE